MSATPSHRLAIAAAADALLEATHDAVALLGPGGEPVARNAAMERLGGDAPLDPPGGDPAREGRDELRHGGRVLERRSVPVRDAEGALAGRLVLLRDITAEREAERLKDDLFALVSHELRTPLTSILGYLELVCDDADGLPPDTRRSLDVVGRNARRLLRLVGDLLFAAQVESGGLSLERGPVDLGEVAAEALETARPAAERAGVALALEAEPVPPLLGDRDRLAQLLDNLLSNAVKFTPRGGEATVRLTAGPRGALVEVRDTGPGIAEADRARLFERFFRSADAVAASVPGIGLGLTIVRAIAEAHGGAVAVAGREGAGATVRVELPYGPDEAR